MNNLEARIQNLGDRIKKDFGTINNPEISLKF